MTERERIELLMKCYNLSSSQFADKTGIQRASVSHILSGRNKPSLEIMLKIYDAFPGLDIKWLMTGVGEEPVSETYVAKEVAEQPLSAGLFGGLENVVAENEERLPLVNSKFAEPVASVAKKSRMQQPDLQRQVDSVASQSEKRRAAQQRTAAQAPAVQRKIKEVRVFYSDGTYEVLIPERG